MKTYIPLDRLKRSRDSGSALYNMHPTDVLGRAGGGMKKKPCDFLGVAGLVIFMGYWMSLFRLFFR